MTENNLDFNFKQDDDFNFIKNQPSIKIDEKNESNISIIEAAMFFGIFGLITTLIFTTFSLASTANHINAESNNLASINTGIKTLYANQTDYSSINNSILISSGVIPSSMISNHSIVSILGGDINIKPSVFNNHSGYSISYSNIEKKYCTKLIYSNIKNFNQIIVNGILVKSDTHHPLEIKELNSSCNLANNLDISFQN